MPHMDARARYVYLVMHAAELFSITSTLDLQVFDDDFDDWVDIEPTFDITNKLKIRVIEVLQYNSNYYYTFQSVLVTCFQRSVGKSSTEVLL